MSYLHCGGCGCAYNVARLASCPRCGLRPGTPADPTEAVIAAAEQLACAMAGATAAQLALAERALDERSARLALPAAVGEVPARSEAPSILRAVRAALIPAPAAAEAGMRSAHLAVLTTAVLAMLTRIPRPARAWLRARWA